nr:MAG TPA: hypothetical protein [Caudoviricetes sp.]
MKNNNQKIAEIFGRLATKNIEAFRTGSNQKERN